MPNKLVRQIYSHTDGDLAIKHVEAFGRDPPRRLLPTRGSIAGPHDHPLEEPHRRLAPRPRVERTNQSSQQPHQTDHVRLPTVPQLSDPHIALRRETQLGPTRHHHTPLKSEVPYIHRIEPPTHSRVRSIRRPHNGVPRQAAQHQRLHRVSPPTSTYRRPPSTPGINRWMRTVPKTSCRSRHRSLSAPRGPRARSG